MDFEKHRQRCRTLSDFIEETYNRAQVSAGAVITSLLSPALSLSQTLSGWREAANRAMLLRDEGSLQAHWLDGRRPDPVAGSA
jgi:hypothetical protein